MEATIVVLVALVLALVLGVIVGFWAGTSTALLRAAARRADLGTHAQMARLWPETLPQRSAADIMSGVIHVALGGVVYDLPVLPRGPSNRWVDEINERYRVLGDALDELGDDTPAVMTRVLAESDSLYDMLLAYDRAGAVVLPPREEIDEFATDVEILRGVIEVWRAAHPLAVSLLEANGQTPGTPPAPSSTPPMPTAGAQARSSA